jgi:hypothetical protein
MRATSAVGFKVGEVVRVLSSTDLTMIGKAYTVECTKDNWITPDLSYKSFGIISLATGELIWFTFDQLTK